MKFKHIMAVGLALTAFCLPTINNYTQHVEVERTNMVDVSVYKRFDDC